MNPTFSFLIYSSTANLPAKWDILAERNIFLSTAYLKVMENSAPANMICNYIGLFCEEELVGIAVSQFLDLSQINSFGERDHRLKTAIRTFVFKNISSKVLIMGNNMLSGQNGHVFSTKLPTATGLLLLHDAATALKALFKSKGTKIQLLIFKDFTASAISFFEIKTFTPYLKFSTQPNMLFEIRESWTSFDNYLNSIQKKYRDQYKRARKKSEDITKKKLSLDEIKTHSSRIYELYMHVAKNAPFNTFYLAETHFENFKELLQDKFLFYGYFMGDKLIGFNTLIKNGTDIDTYFLGYDEVHQRDKMLYLNMLYDMIGYSINKRYKRIVFARTALEIKSSVGAKPTEMYGMMKHSNYFVNLFISKAFTYFEPKLEWKERNPFKDIN